MAAADPADTTALDLTMSTAVEDVVMAATTALAVLIGMIMIIKEEDIALEEADVLTMMITIKQEEIALAEATVLAEASAMTMMTTIKEVAVALAMATVLTMMITIKQEEIALTMMITIKPEEIALAEASVLAENTIKEEVVAPAMASVLTMMTMTKIAQMTMIKIRINTTMEQINTRRARSLPDKFMLINEEKVHLYGNIVRAFSVEFVRLQNQHAVEGQARVT
jgi:hypothetical protein